MKNNINLLVPSYLIHSYLYYVQHTSIIEDEDFDRLCKTLHDEYDNITHHHKHLIDKESLLAGTGYAVEYKEYTLVRYTQYCTVLQSISADYANCE